MHVVRRNQAPLPAGIEMPDLASVWHIVVTRSAGAFWLLVEEGDANRQINPEAKYTLERRE